MNFREGSIAIRFFGVRMVDDLYGGRPFPELVNGQTGKPYTLLYLIDKKRQCKFVCHSFPSNGYLMVFYLKMLMIATNESCVFLKKLETSVYFVGNMLA